MKRIKIFDTTLRDGEQSPGCSMNLPEKIEMAKQLEKLGVDIIEAGFAIASPMDHKSVQAIAGAVTNCTVASLARCTKGDIDAAWDAVKGARHPRIHVFLATSEIHMKYKLQMSPEQVLQRIRQQPVVRIHKHQPRAARSGHSGIARRRHAAVFLMQHAHARLRHRQRAQPGKRAVRGAVVHRNQLPALKRLRLHTLNAARKRFPVLEAGHDDAHRRLHSGFSFSRRRANAALPSFRFAICTGAISG